MLVPVMAVELAYGNVFAVVAVEVIAPVILSAPPKVLVPVVVKAPTTVDDACDTKPLVNVPRPVCVRAPRTESEPNDAFVEKRLVLDAVVEKRFVVVAFVSNVLLFTVRSEPLFPIVVFPFASMRKAVVVEKAAVDEETEKSGVVPPAAPATESLA